LGRGGGPPHRLLCFHLPTSDPFPITDDRTAVIAASPTLHADPLLDVTQQTAGTAYCCALTVGLKPFTANRRALTTA